MILDRQREWLETNGAGGFASSTVTGRNTKRSHSLLCAATKPPHGQIVLVNCLEEVIEIEGEQIILSDNLFGHHERAVQYSPTFSCDSLPKWIYELPGKVLLEKSLWMPHDHNKTILRYVLKAGGNTREEFILRLRPLVSGRDRKVLLRQSDDYDTLLECGTSVTGAHEVVMKPSRECPPIIFSHDGRFIDDGAWYYSHRYECDLEDGEPAEEDLYSPGTFRFELSRQRSALLLLSTVTGQLSIPAPSPSRTLWIDAEINRRTSLSSTFSGLNEKKAEVAARLARAADQFIVRRGEAAGFAIVSSYPKVEISHRCELMALHGLCLTTKRFYEAASILLRHARLLQSRESEKDYSTENVLWLVHRAAMYRQRSGDTRTADRAIFPVLREWLLETVDINKSTFIDFETGFLRSNRTGNPTTQALWLNALCSIRQISDYLKDEATSAICEEQSERIRSSLTSQDKSTLATDEILTIALPWPLLNDKAALNLVVQLKDRFIDQSGNITSSSIETRRLVGHFLTTYLKTHQRSPKVLCQITEWINSYLDMLFDRPTEMGDAVIIGELLRVWVEELANDE